MTHRKAAKYALSVVTFVAGILAILESPVLKELMEGISIPRVVWILVGVFLLAFSGFREWKPVKNWIVSTTPSGKFRQMLSKVEYDFNAAQGDTPMSMIPGNTAKRRLFRRVDIAKNLANIGVCAPVDPPADYDPEWEAFMAEMIYFMKHSTLKEARKEFPREKSRLSI